MTLSGMLGWLCERALMGRNSCRVSFDLGFLQ